MRIDRYEVHEQVTRDGSSVVYRAQDPNLRREVAIRVLDAAQTEVDLDRFRKGAQALAKLRHEGIVSVHSMGVQQGCPYLVMDHVKGRTLAERVKRQGPLRARDAAEALRAVGEALDYAHRRGVLHRDVRPDNVILTPSGQALISDFSLAKGLEEQASGLTRSDTWEGARGFLAPEQVEGRQDLIGPATDVYGLGATLYFALTGQPPFAQDMPGDRRPRLLPPSGVAPEIPAALDQICLNALQSDPEQRYATLDLMGADLSSFLDGRGLSRRSRKSWSRALPVGESALPLAAVAGVITLGAAIGFGAALWSRSGGGPAAAAAAPPPAVGASPGPSAVSPVVVAPTPAAPEVSPERVAALVAEGIRLAEDDAFAPALERLDEVLGLDPDHVEALAWRAYVHAAERRWEPSMQDAQRALNLDPNSAKALEARLMCVTSLGRWPEALADSERWAQLRPDSADPLSIRGAVLSQMGRHAEALACLEAAIRLEPSNSRLYTNRALCKLQSGQLEAALRDFDEAAELFDKPSHQPFTNRGMCYRMLENPEAALADFKRGCEVEPDAANNWNCLAVGLIDTDDLEGAIGALDQALKVDPTFLDALLNRARILRELGRLREAREDLLAALDLAPPSEKATVRNMLRAVEQALGGAGR